MARGQRCPLSAAHAWRYVRTATCIPPGSLYHGDGQWHRVMQSHADAATAAARARGLGAEDIEAWLVVGACRHPDPVPLPLSLRPRFETVLLTRGSAGDVFVPPTDDLRLEIKTYTRIW